MKRVEITTQIDLNEVTIDQAIATLKDLKETITEEFRDKLMLTIEPYEYYGSSCIEYAVYYDREKTKEELEAEEIRIRARKEEQVARVTKAAKDLGII